VRVGMLDGLVLFGLIKYGAWTLFVMLLYFEVYLSALSSTKLFLFAVERGLPNGIPPCSRWAFSCWT